MGPPAALPLRGPPALLPLLDLRRPADRDVEMALFLIAGDRIDDESLSVRRHVVAAAARSRGRGQPQEQRDRRARVDSRALGADRDSHEIPVGGLVIELLAVGAPGGRLTTGRGNAPLATGAGKRLYE